MAQHTYYKEISTDIIYDEKDTIQINGYVLEIETHTRHHLKLFATAKPRGLFNLSVYQCDPTGKYLRFTLDYPVDAYVELTHDIDRTPEEIFEVLRAYATLISVGFFDCLDCLEDEYESNEEEE